MATQSAHARQIRFESGPATFLGALLAGAFFLLYFKLKDIEDLVTPEDRVEVQGFGFDPSEDPHIPDEVE